MTTGVDSPQPPSAAIEPGGTEWVDERIAATIDAVRTMRTDDEGASDPSAASPQSAAATSEAADIVSEARREAFAIYTSARDDAAAVIREAREEAEEILVAAKVEAATIREAARADMDGPVRSDASSTELPEAANPMTAPPTVEFEPLPGEQTEADEAANDERTKGNRYVIHAGEIPRLGEDAGRDAVAAATNLRGLFRSEDKPNRKRGHRKR